MEAHYQQPSCLSVDPHNDDVTDPILHYFGCLEGYQRDSFFDSTSSYWTEEITKLEKAGIRRADAEAKVEARRQTWQKDCSDELRRLSLILGALAKDNKLSYLLKSLASSRELWRSSRPYQSGIARVRGWRASRHMPNGATIVSPQNATEHLYDPDNLPVSVMAFKDGRPHNIGSQYAAGTFPNQSTNVHDLLQRDTLGLFSLLKRKKDRTSSTTLTWLHVPSNNMLEIIASYYGERRPTRNQMRYGDEASRATRLLREFFWRGQEFGDLTKPSSRFMRPFCEFIAPNREYMGSETEKMVVYTPFLHWETSRQLTLIARNIEENLTVYTNTQRLKAHSEREKRIKDRQGLRTVIHASKWPYAVKSTIDEGRREEFKLIEQGNKQYRCKYPLGQYLLDAARLYEEVRNYEDTSLIQKYLFADPPLHLRRTLDQGYYTTIESTRPENRNQIVYRATTPTEFPRHHFDQSKGLWVCSDHEFSLEGCDECRANIRRVSSVVMVDQLWMWVLDPGMIITCFPKRYGVHGRDPSGVFEAAQRRLTRDRPIHSVFAIAQTILDECSNTFFDRVKDFNAQPPVLDIFSKAIQDVSHKQAMVSNRLWHWIDHTRWVNRQERPHEDLYTPEWTFSIEGGLEREIQDIVEELETMISVNKTQRDVYEKFIHHASRLMKADFDDRVWLDKDGEVLYGGPKLLSRVEDRIRYFESMLQTALNASNQVKDLSQLRQQQDSVIQARQSVKLSLDSIDQGRTIMAFTIVTIIFAPLSFLSSIFGMNNAEFGDNQWKVTDQLKIILTISAGVISLSLVFASRRVRSTAIRAATCVTHPLLALRRVIRSISIILDYSDWIMKNRKGVFQETSTGVSSTIGV
ncbi:hypothetical protein F4678DRAFT_469688 [Xylaria arbuscula]|nr:hypothetical protein F4678DRAFT_469688 [Xylaria arbuscula]